MIDMKKEPVRILYVNGGTMDMGGISSYMMNYYRKFDKEKIQIDFIVQGDGGIYDSEIEEMGGKVYHLPTKRQNYLENTLMFHKIMRSGKYKIIHCHADGMNGNILKRAYRHKIPVRISHSHNTEHLTQNKLRLLYHENARKKIPKYATHLWACSDAAGEWLYGEKNQFQVIPNAIETSKFAFDSEKRNKLRGKYNLLDKYVIGHIGKLDYQKNQEFLIEILPEILIKEPKAIVVLVGDGKNRSMIEQMIDEKNLKEHVLMLGRMSNVDELLNIFDVFVLPSRFEGLPVVSVEVQANGLPVYCSDLVTKETNMTGSVQFISLNNKLEWINAILSKKSRCEAQKDLVKKAGYDIQIAAKALQDTYLEMQIGEKNETSSRC